LLLLLLQLLFKEDCSVDDLIDVIEGNRRYVKCLYVYNKVTARGPGCMFT
jgi:ribosome-interacting GTPase 1